MVLFIVAVLALIIMAMIYDQRVFVPFNATFAVTQTWRAQTTLTLRTPSRGTRHPATSPTPGFDKTLQSAWEAAPAWRAG
jgi:hypothetical protein